MAKVLVSFLALKNDTDNQTVLKNSPNYNLHKYFYSHDKHIIIYASKDHLKKAVILNEKIRKDFPGHNTLLRLIEINDPINIIEIRDKLFVLLQEFSDDKIDIFMSPGTPSMQIAWFLLHVSGTADSNLIQGREAVHSKSGTAEFFKVDIESSSIPYAALLKYTSPEDLDTEYPIGKSINTIYERAEKIALTDKVPVLIRGESGTGKEYLAKYIHNNSSRQKEKFTIVNCSAIGDDLLESRLFGHKKGSFTGAVIDHTGFFEEAENGTIFLDEIGDISPKMQQSLLRVFQNEEIMAVGDNKVRKTNVRIISATNKDLETLCEKGLFRWDLYYRLNVTELELPPLRLRDKSEIKEIIEFLLKDKAVKFNKKPFRFTKETYSLFIQYSFPGNVRELENLIENFYVFCEDKIKQSDLPKRVTNFDKSKSLLWEDVTREHFKFVLQLCSGNKTQTANLLGCSLNTLKKYLN